MTPSNNGGLLMADAARCLGFLLDAGDKGIYCPNNGRVHCTSAEAAAHNALLSKMFLDGLDRNCAIGQGATFYYHADGRVTTWTGALVATGTPGCRSRETVTFIRSGKKFRGRVHKDADCVFFKRVA